MMKEKLTKLRLTIARQWGSVWSSVAVTVLALAPGVFSLALAANAYGKLDSGALMAHYLAQPELLELNLLPGLLAAWLVYFLTRRVWCASLGAGIPVLAIALVDYFKIQLRGDPLLASDLGLTAEAGKIMGNYTLDFTWLVWTALGTLILGTVLALLAPKSPLGWRERALGAASCLSLMAVGALSMWISPAVYDRTTDVELIDRWSDVEVSVSKGSVYPFLYSVRDLLPDPPGEYDRTSAGLMLAGYEGADIPEEQKVSVMGIMLEAFCDLTDYEALAQLEGVQQVYQPWHQLEEQSVSGELLTNIFAGGTVDTEWGFLTGYTSHDDFQQVTDSYVWYLRDQGYQTFGSHPGFGWFYDRENVNRYLGFQDYWFTEEHYGALVDPVAAQWHSDDILVRELLQQLEQRVEDGPCFSFSVSYQNHGPYEEQDAQSAYLPPDGLGLSQKSRNIFNNYLSGISSTISAMCTLVQGLEEMEEPVVLVLFGDHKPWAGNGDLAYRELGLSFDIGTLQGLYDYYSTPYLIWANSAAKETLDRPFQGDGGDFSPAFLMPELFDQCGWQGPGFMQAARQMREISPMVHSRGLFLVDGQVTGELPKEDRRYYQQFLQMQYFREQEGRLVPEQ